MSKTFTCLVCGETYAKADAHRCLDRKLPLDDDKLARMRSAAIDSHYRRREASNAKELSGAKS